MLSISLPIKGAGGGDYYLKLAAEDYYGRAQEPPGRWFGQGARILELEGKVERSPFLNLLSGLSPDGTTRLVQNAGDKHRQSAWDLTLSASKCVSVLWAAAPVPIREQIEQAHDRAVDTALRFLETTAGFSRRGARGESTVPAALAFACFQHGTSRAQDPQLHTHALMLNVGIRADGTTGTVISKAVFERKMVAGAVYQAELANQLHRELGLSIVPERVGFHIDGVPKKLCEEFSKRRAAIVAALAHHGTAGAVAAKVAALESRQKKKPLKRDVLFPQWQQTASAYGLTPEKVCKLLQSAHHLSADEKRFAKRFIDAAMPLQSATRGDLKTIDLARRLAIEHRVDSSGLLRALAGASSARGKRGLHVEWQRLLGGRPWEPPQRRWLHIRREAVLPNAGTKLLQRVKLPVAVLEVPKLVLGKRAEPKVKWWEMRWKKEVGLGELRIQNRVLFPKAPKWSPLYQRSLPALRLTPKRSGWDPELSRKLKSQHKSRQQTALNKRTVTH